jgi:hypothetical protein
MTVPPYAVAYVVSILTAWSADHFNTRALHSAVLSSVGAIGFLAANRVFSCIPPLPGAKQQHAQHFCNWAGDCAKHIVGSAGPDLGRLNLQGSTKDKGISNRAIDELCNAVIGCCWICKFTMLLPVEEYYDARTRCRQDGCRKRVPLLASPPRSDFPTGIFSRFRSRRRVTVSQRPIPHVRRQVAPYLGGSTAR